VRQGFVLSPVLFAIYIDDVSTCSKLYPRSHVILYADDILILAPTVTLLDRLFAACEIELTHLDMAINSKKSCCLRVGPRYDKPVHRAVIKHEISPVLNILAQSSGLSLNNKKSFKTETFANSSADTLDR